MALNTRSFFLTYFMLRYLLHCIHVCLVHSDKKLKRLRLGITILLIESRTSFSDYFPFFFSFSFSFFFLEEHRSCENLDADDVKIKTWQNFKLPDVERYLQLYPIVSAHRYASSLLSLLPFLLPFFLPFAKRRIFAKPSVQRSKFTSPDKRREIPSQPYQQPLTDRVPNPS